MIHKNFLSMLLLTGVGLTVFAQTRQQPKPIADQYIVILKESAAKPVIKQAKKNEDREQKFKDNNEARENNLKKLSEVKSKKNIKEENVKHNYADAIVGFAAKLSKGEVDALKSDPEVEGVYQDFQLNFTLPGIKTEETILNPPDCFLKIAGGPADGTSIRKLLWIMDTGVDLDHPDLQVVSRGPYPASFTGAPIDDQDGHGTHVAGIAAAKNNSLGITGVCAGVRVVPVNVIAPYSTNAYSTSFSTLAAGLNHVAKYGALGDVVNLSLGAYSPVGCPNTSYPVTTAIQALANEGVFVCMSAGNDGGYASSNYPGCIDGSRIVTVGALNCNSTWASYSNYGAGVDFVAVGSNVYSCYKNGGYATLSGTSMATPVVSGILIARGWPASGALVNCNGTMTPIAIR